LSTSSNKLLLTFQVDGKTLQPAGVLNPRPTKPSRLALKLVDAHKPSKKKRDGARRGRLRPSPPQTPTQDIVSNGGGPSATILEAKRSKYRRDALARKGAPILSFHARINRPACIELSPFVPDTEKKKNRTWGRGEGNVWRNKAAAGFRSIAPNPRFFHRYRSSS